MFGFANASSASSTLAARLPFRGSLASAATRAARSYASRASRGGGQRNAPIVARRWLSTPAAALRIVHVTDVYTLDNFPHLKTLIVEKRDEFEQRYGPDAVTISVLTGDFLMPYLLSAIDKGRGMMKMLNNTPVDFLIWGNHEDNLSPADVFAREREYEGTWLNTNMPAHETMAGSACQATHAWLNVGSKRIAILGVTSHTSPKPGAFNGAPILDPWATLAEWTPRLRDEGADLVLPLCHLYEDQDEKTARDFDFPLILSGHDHHIVDRMVEGTRIIKPGMDAHAAQIVDLVWDPQLTIDAHVAQVASYKADGDLALDAAKAYAVLDKMRHTQLAVVPDEFRPLSSVDSRGQLVTMGAFLLSEIRDALNAYRDTVDCCIIKGASCPRAAKAYEDDAYVSLETLRAEIQAKDDVNVYKLSGHALCRDHVPATTASSRRRVDDVGFDAMIQREGAVNIHFRTGHALKHGVRERWGHANPGYMQIDDGITVDGEGYVTHVRGEPIDEERIYRVASFKSLERERDGEIIGKELAAHPERMPGEDDGVQCHALLVGHWARRLWERIYALADADGDGRLSAEEFATLDEDGLWTACSGRINRRELKHAIARAGYETFSGEYTLVDAVLEAAGDLDGDGKLSRWEINAHAAQEVARHRDSERDRARDVAAA